MARTHESTHCRDVPDLRLSFVSVSVPVPVSVSVLEASVSVSVSLSVSVSGFPPFHFRVKVCLPQIKNIERIRLNPTT